MSETCPHCGLELPDPQVFICPHCNQPLKIKPHLGPDDTTLPRLRVTRVSHPLPVHDMEAGQPEHEVPEAAPEQPEPTVMAPVIPEPVIPQPMISEPAVTAPVIPEAEPEPIQPEAEWPEPVPAVMAPVILEIPELMISKPAISEAEPQPAMPEPIQREAEPEQTELVILEAELKPVVSEAERQETESSVMAPMTLEPEILEPDQPEPEILEPEILEAAPEQPEPTVMAPVIPEPEILEPVVPEPEIPEPVVPEPIISALAIPEPVIPEPVIPEPVIPEPVILEPIQPETGRQEIESSATGPHVWEAERQETVPAVYPDLPIYVPQPSPLLPLPLDRGPSQSVLPRAPVAPVANRHRPARILVGILLFAVIVGGAGALYVVSHNPVIYQSSLKGSLDNWEVGSDCTPKSDGYHIRSGSICYAPIGSQANADITVHVAQLRGSTELFYGIVLRSAPRQHYYLFGIDGNGKWAFVNVPGTTKLPVSVIAPTLDSAVRSGIHKVNTLEVKMKGTHFDFFINGTKVGEINDSHYATGQIGLSGEDGVEVVYTDLSIVKVN